MKIFSTKCIQFWQDIRGKCLWIAEFHKLCCKHFWSFCRHSKIKIEKHLLSMGSISWEDFPWKNLLQISVSYNFFFRFLLFIIFHAIFFILSVSEIYIIKNTIQKWFSHIYLIMIVVWIYRTACLTNIYMQSTWCWTNSSLLEQIFFLCSMSYFVCCES